MKIVRWILVPAAGLAAWYATFIAGAFTYGPVERIICPSGDFVSGTCMNATVGKFMQGWIVLFVAISGVGVVAASAWAAPTHKALVAWLIYAVGASVAGDAGEGSLNDPAFGEDDEALGFRRPMELRVRAASTLRP